MSGVWFNVLLAALKSFKYQSVVDFLLSIVDVANACADLTLSYS